MPDIPNILQFIAAALILLVTPGPAVLYIVARSMHQGRRGGIVSVMGIGLGTLFHVAAATLGISAILMSSSLAFNIVKYLGAAYLIYLGIRTLRAREDLNSQIHIAPRSLRSIFTQGFIVNLLNPKTALFFFAFLPQFVDPARGNVAVQVFFLGTLFATMGMCSDGCYAMLAGTAGNWLKSSPRILRGQRYFSGSVYILLGLTTAFAGNDHKASAVSFS